MASTESWEELAPEKMMETMQELQAEVGSAAFVDRFRKRWQAERYASVELDPEEEEEGYDSDADESAARPS